MYASWLSDHKTFQIKTLCTEHTCAMSFKNKFVNSKLIAEKYVDQWRANPNWNFAGMLAQLRIDTNMDASKWQFYHARKAARQMIDGGINDRYSKLKEYAAEVLTVIRVDLNNQMYLVAYALVEAETKDTWGWFLEQLAADLELNNSFDIVWISDKFVEKIKQESVYCCPSTVDISLTKDTMCAWNDCYIEYQPQPYGLHTLKEIKRKTKEEEKFTIGSGQNKEYNQVEKELRSCNVQEMWQ
ncbi:hypothetical protein QYF36_025358 [Acer negundo]|nr:hypothetical protein QYF36_025358 [Acer negundo]